MAAAATATPSAPIADSDAPFLRFPPFPSPPDGKVVIPFKHFKASGICVPIDEDIDEEDVEVDGLGIPTVPLRVKHTTDSVEKKKKKKKKNSHTVSVAEDPPKRRTWWEEWEELEDIRKNYYDIKVARADRLYQAANDFKNGRAWPKPVAVMNMWDQFRLYVGLLHQAVNTRKQQAEDADVDDDDDDDDEPMAEHKEAPVFVVDKPPPAVQGDQRPKKRKRLYRAIGSAYDEAEADEDEDKLPFQEKLNRRLEDKDIKLDTFLNDPEQSMKVFFSSFFRQRGLIWSEPRCTALPILVSFFLRYLLRSRVFPEPEYDGPLRRALEVVNKACKELPATFVITRALSSDALIRAFDQLWPAEQYNPAWVLDVPPDTNVNMDTAKDGDAEFEEALKASGIIDVSTLVPIPVSDADAAAKETPTEGGWGDAGGNSSSAGWGEASGGGGTWGDDDAANWGASDTTRDWTGYKDPTLDLAALLGPTRLPLTHEPGIIEHSTRRIVAFHPPLAPRTLDKNASPAEAVEEDLERRFARIVLAPWPEWDQTAYPDIVKPVLTPQSKGRVVDEQSEISAMGVTEGEEDEKGWAKRRPHDPFKDNITLLVEPKNLELLIVGMGLGAKWVEIARSEEDDETIPVEVKETKEEKKKGKGKNKLHGKPRYWYMREFMLMVTSFHTDVIESLR
ncbi:hypothetical protein EW146_g8179 [Bondarzewia mesenterica]|uniref:Uncharacterized protein n=1 Tax=Bondarzewia mesenterica TaxID=1095465 RepID=A0A4S4LH42_9AGAM|nr:hypothetical protein EW146_g8179 [Bondarzewia mesenterica]